MLYKNVELYNVHELLDDEESGGKIFCRIPNELRLQLNDSAKNNALQTPGCEIRFNLKGDQASVTLQNTEKASVAEVFQGDFLTAVHVIDTTPTEIVVERHPHTEIMDNLSQANNLLYDVNLTRIVLPWRPPCRSARDHGGSEWQARETRAPRCRRRGW